MISAGLYVRVSSQGQAEKGYSIPEQTERLKKYAEAMGWKVYRVYTDAGFTGANTRRPALTELIYDVSASRVNKVVVYKLDRLSRSQRDTLDLIEDKFLSHGCDFVSMSENFDTATPFGKATIGILAVFAQLEREQITERLSMGRKARIKAGKYKGNKIIPIGYKYINGELRVDEYEAGLMRKVFSLAAAGISPGKIADRMNSAGEVPNYGKWSSRLVRDRLRSRVYIGEVSYNGEWFPGIHVPIIDKDTFQQAQEQLDRRSENYRYKGQRDGTAGSYLAGILYCGKCGRRYASRTSKIQKKGAVYRYSIYQCTARKLPGLSCDNKNWNRDELDSLVFGEIAKLKFDPAWEMKPVDTNRVDTLQKEIRKVETELSRLIDLYAVDNMPVDILEKRIKSAQEKKDNLTLQVQALQKETPLTGERVKSEVSNFADILKTNDLHEIRAVVADLIEKIVIYDNDIEIHWRFT